MRECPQCSVRFVPRPAKQRFCSQLCVRRWIARQRDLSGPRNPRYNGGFSRTPDGRTIVCTRDGGYVFWYRVLVEDAIGRPLGVDELVHHINGDCTDDRLDNLQIVGRAEHIEMHRDELLAARGIARKAA